MSVRGWAPGKLITNPRGMWTATASKRMGNPERASFMLNARISPGVVGIRPGTSSAGFNSAGIVTGLYNWVTPSGAYLVLYQDSTTIGVFNQSSLAQTTIAAIPGNTRAPSFEDLDVWTFIAGYDTSGLGTFQTLIYDGTNTDTAFRAPVLLTAATAVDGGSGFCTAGTHFIGFIYQDRTGFSGKPSTTVASSPISVTLAAGLRQINISVTLPALPDGGGNSTLFLIMTRADTAQNWYFIDTDAQTGSIGQQPVPFNTPVTLNFVASLSDEDIAASAQPANGPTATPNYFLLLTQDGSGAGPFDPSAVVAYGTRMCYVVGSTLYISDPDNPQSLTGDQNVVPMPNKRNIGTVFPLPNSTSLFITGDRWTAYVTDNSDVPATWPIPIGVSGSLGAPFPACVCHRTSGNYAWIVTEGGPYRFSGTYDDLPLTYLCSDLWKRVNWAAAYVITIVDDTTAKKIYITVPLDGVPEPNAILVIDYTNGLTYDKVDISYDALGTLISSVAIVKELSSNVTNAWFGPTIAGPIPRFDTTVATDMGQPFQTYWESGLVRTREDPIASVMLRVGAFDVWMRGIGAPLVTLYGPDHVVTTSLTLLLASGIPAPNLSNLPGQMYALKSDLSKVENFTIQFGANGSWELSAFRAYVKADLFNR